MAMFAAVSVRERKIRNGSSGDRERSSIATNARMRAAEPPSRANVLGAPQPSLPARVKA